MATNCLICDVTLSDAALAALTSGSVNNNNNNLSSQNKSKSLCVLLNLAQSQFEDSFLNSPYCTSCLEKIGYIDRLLGDLVKIQSGLSKCRTDIEDQLTRSFYKRRVAAKIRNSRANPVSTVEFRKQILEEIELAKQQAQSFGTESDSDSDGEEKKSRRSKKRKRKGYNLRQPSPLKTPSPEKKSDVPVNVNANSVKEEVLRCDEEGCRKKFRSAATLEGHIRKAHPGNVQTPENAKVNCPICDKPCSTAHHLKLHMRCHSKTESAFTCDVCQAGFTTALLLKHHIKALHGDQSKQQQIACKFCMAKFKFRHNLTYHMKTQHANHAKGSLRVPITSTTTSPTKSPNSKPIPEMIPINNKGGMKMRDFGCPTCGKQLSSKQSLKNHMSKHANNKAPLPSPRQYKFKCKGCELTFSAKKLLEEHHATAHGGSLIVESNGDAAFVKNLVNSF